MSDSRTPLHRLPLLRGRAHRGEAQFNPARLFGRKMTTDNLIAKQMRVTRLENPQCELVSLRHEKTWPRQTLDQGEHDSSTRSGKTPSAAASWRSPIQQEEKLGKHKEALEYATAAQSMAPLDSEVAETLEDIKSQACCSLRLR